MKYDNLPPLIGGPYWYLASPYSKYPSGTSAAFIDICAVTGKFMLAGVPVFSPIAHSHPVSQYGDIDQIDHDFWMNVDRPLMDAAGGMILVTMEGWEESRGVNHEMKVFLEAGKFVAFYDPNEDRIVGRAQAVDVEVDDV